LAHRSCRCGFVVDWNREWGVSECCSWHGSFLVRVLRNGEPIYSGRREHQRLAPVRSFSSTKSTIWRHPWTTTLMLGLIGRHTWGGTYHITLQVTNSFDFIPECVATRLMRSLPFVGVTALAFGNVSSEGVNVPFRLWGFFLQERYQIVSGGCSEGRNLLVIE